MYKKVVLVIRIVVGAAMVIFGANKIFSFSEPKPQDNMGEEMKVLMDILHSPFMVVIGMLELLGGISLLIGKYVPLAITILIAIMLNAFMLHIFYDPKNFLFSLMFLILCFVLGYAYKDRFKSLLSA